LYHIQRNAKGDRVRRGNQREEIVLTRLRLGHCTLNKKLGRTEGDRGAGVHIKKVSEHKR